MKREEKASALYAAIGEVQEQFIQEAMEYEQVNQKWRRSEFLKRTTAIAAGLILLVTVFGRLAGGTSETPISLTEYAKSVSTAEMVADKNNLQLYGQAALYWSFDGGKTVYTKAISGYEYNQYQNTLRDSQETVPDTTLLVWVCDEEGNVSSPYLRRSDGNIAFGRLFEYSPEITPSERCVTYLKELMT